MNPLPHPSRRFALLFLLTVIVFPAFYTVSISAQALAPPTMTVLRNLDLFNDGGHPVTAETLVLSGDTLYGALGDGGNNGATGRGTIFSIKTNGTAFTVLHTFSNLAMNGTNADGAHPSCTLKVAGGKIYGTAKEGGSLGNGVVYSMNLDGSAFTVLYNFTGATPNTGLGLHSPAGEMVLIGQTLYGITLAGGTAMPNDFESGRIFAVNTNGGGTIVHTFVNSAGNQGYSPYAGLTLSNGKLYGAALNGAANLRGVLYSINPDGSQYQVIHTFTMSEGSPGHLPLVAGSKIYGTTLGSNQQNRGIIFSVDTTGANFSVMHTYPFGGVEEQASGLVLSGDTLYGTTLYGGTAFEGTLFSIKTNGTGYQTLWSFTRTIDGRYPGRLLFDNGFLYGMAPSGGTMDRGTVFRFTLPKGSTPFDFDGDGKTDLSIFRPGPGEWWWLRSSNGGNGAVQFGTSTDRIVASDYTGDGKTDVAFWRPSTGQWFILRSEDLSFFAFPFGATGDVPVPADYDGDGKADASVFRPSTATWFISKSTGGTQITTFGAPGDLPVPADYDGDGKAEIAIYRPSGANGSEWWVQRSSNSSVFALQFGASTDKAVPADYTGDGRADVAFWRPSNGNWFVLRSEDFSFFAFPFGSSTDVPTPGDYDGDGKTDAAVFRPSNSTWFANRSTGGTLIQQFGITGDLPLPNAFVR